MRNDMESGHWRQEEYSVNATFPFDPDKIIRNGMRLSFLDPATGIYQFFEVRNVTNIEPEAYQQIIAEHIVVAELSDDHINNAEITDKTPAEALTTVLTGTLWAVGNSTVPDVNSVDISRGSVWQAIGAIRQNYNCYIEPRITVDASGAITGRYLDIIPATGVFRGLRLSIQKNMSDSSVVYDDSETYTALYGYGGSVDVPRTGTTDGREELTFADVVWTATAEHPAKPSGQTYLEDPAKTALYGRNGRPRYGYYQNSDIKDAEVLLQKTWETLKTCVPKISITGTVTDLRRLGFPDVYVRLHDIAVVNVTDTGETFEKQIIRNEVDLVDETATLPEIGDYIPNIIYINREEAKKSGGGGGGGGHGQDNKEHEDGEWYQEWKNDQEGIGLVVGQYNGGWKVKAGQIILAMNEDGGATAKIEADVVDIPGLLQAISGEGISCTDLDCYGSVNVDQNIYCDESITGYTVIAENGLEVQGGLLDCYDIDCNDVDAASLKVPDGYLTVGSDAASWQSETIPTFTFSQVHNFVYRTNGIDYTTSGKIIGTSGTKTIHYLGKA